MVRFASGAPAVIALLTSAALAAPVPSADAPPAELGPCDNFSSMRTLPEGFTMVAAGQLSRGLEFFRLTDGRCTCDNMPSLDRAFGKPSPQGINWKCRMADDDERATAEERRSN
jgi:hypothetical protein